MALHLAPASLHTCCTDFPATGRLIAVMTRAHEIEYHGRSTVPAVERASKSIWRALDWFELGWQTTMLHGIRPTTAPSKRAQKWRDAWLHLVEGAANFQAQIATVKAMAPQEIAPGEVRWTHPEIVDGVPRCPPGGDHVLDQVEDLIRQAQQMLGHQLDSIPMPPTGRSGKIKAPPTRGYAEASRILAPIRTGRVQLWGAANRRNGVTADIGDRVTDREIASAMLEAPDWPAPLSTCLEIADHAFPDDEDIDMETAAANLAKQVRSALGRLETR